MEKFSNNRENYWNQIKKELSDVNDSGDFRFQYLEIGQLLSHGFSVTLTEKNPRELVLKTWNAEYDNQRFDKGIFNLDRLAITDRKVELNSQESKTINKLLDSKLELTNWGGIVLDGLFCQFETNDRKLDWNTNEEINDDLIELVELLRNKAIHNTV
ncbi:hypothetical protein V6R21_24625 [Limibacter armeniacum]|uniref:hypothetical protein n=1 Tax=Limibacter armeniacum TaxID=466084 RepID=UPI002FE6B278